MFEPIFWSAYFVIGFAGVVGALANIRQQVKGGK
jgi:hypothetical protein